MKAYHFTNGNKLRDGRDVPAIGEWLEHEGPIIPCQTGLHASEHPMDALKYAPGAILHIVELDGELASHGDPVDKHCGRRRKIIATIDATQLLFEFARWCALSVLDKWQAPEVVKEYLHNDESKKSAAESAARSAAWSAQRDQFALMVDAAFAECEQQKGVAE